MVTMKPSDGIKHNCGIMPLNYGLNLDEIKTAVTKNDKQELVTPPSECCETRAKTSCTALLGFFIFSTLFVSCFAYLIFIPVTSVTHSVMHIRAVKLLH